MRTDKEILIRLKSPTPKFWKKMRKFFLGLGAVGVIVAQGGEYYDFIPEQVKWVFATAGLMGWLISSMTSEIDPEKAIMKSNVLANHNLDNPMPSEEILWKDKEDRMFVNYITNTNISEEKMTEINAVFEKFGYFPISEKGILPLASIQDEQGV